MSSRKKYLCIKTYLTWLLLSNIEHEQHVILNTCFRYFVFLMSWIIFRLGLDPKMLAKILNMSSGRCWSSDTYNPCPGVFENVPSSNNYDGGFGTALMTKVKPVVVERRERENSVCKSNWILLFNLLYFWQTFKIDIIYTGLFLDQ